ncbi:NADPH-dependent F420 reductase [Streptomyces sp. NPDC051172]|uniref:NADPH-dependent F420 reductase n=1 Tax=Streptomyces sp. NPDC051172 TaxID=3155796 RepID=UPI0034183407
MKDPEAIGLPRIPVAAGIPVVVANSRGPESLGGLVAELGPLATAGTVEQAAEAGDFVLLAVPLTAHTVVPAALLRGRTVLDTSNYYPFRDDRIAELDDEKLTTGELVQRHFAGAGLVKVFNNILAHHIPQLARPSGAVDRTALPVASDDTDAKTRAAALVERLGFDTVDAGPLAESWRFEPRPPPTPGSTSPTRPYPTSVCSTHRARRCRPPCCGPPSTVPSGCGWSNAPSESTSAIRVQGLPRHFGRPCRVSATGQGPSLHLHRRNRSVCSS